MNLSGISIMVIICYVMGEVIKKIFKEKLNKYIPLILTLLGGALGLIIYITNKELMLEVGNIYEAIVIGLLCGNSSTGANQIIKQMLKKEEENKIWKHRQQIHP